MSDQWLQMIFSEYARTVYRIVKSITQDEQFAEDITQESFFELFFMDRNRFQNTDKVRAWLLKTASNKSFNYIKRKKRLTYVPAEFFDAIETHFKTNPEKQLTEKELIQETKKAIHSLPDDFRTVILLYYYAELSYLKISTILDIPVGTVKSRLNRARLLIKKLMEIEEGLGEGVFQHEQ